MQVRKKNFHDSEVINLRFLVILLIKLSYNNITFTFSVSPFIENRIYLDFGGGECTEDGVTEVNEQFGNILSPSYEVNNTGTYPNDANCQWHIKVAAEDVVRMSFVEFDVEEG